MEPLDIFSIQERMQFIERELDTTLGHLKALEFALRLSIATHANTNALLAALDVFEDGLGEKNSAVEAKFSSEYKRAFSAGIAAVRAEVKSYSQYGD